MVINTNQEAWASRCFPYGDLESFTLTGLIAHTVPISLVVARSVDCLYGAIPTQGSSTLFARCVCMLEGSLGSIDIHRLIKKLVAP